MPINPKYLAPFCEDQFFHVFNRTNGSHKLCRDQENFEHFTHSFEQYLCDVLDIYSYCILPSHFHYVVKIKRLSGMEKFLDSIKSKSKDINKIVVRQFQSFFTSYTMAFNSYHDRQGSLFNHRFRRVELEDAEAFRSCAFYVHTNPVHHSITESFLEYPWSSYPIILSDEPTTIKREEVLELFGGREEFINYHLEHKPIIAEPRRKQ